MLYAVSVLVTLMVVTVGIYNRLVADRALVDNAWSDIDVQLKRRHDLIPRLVSAVSAYADYEKATLMAVTELRAQSEATAALPRKAAVEEALGHAMHQLIGLVESYPDLKADQSFIELQENLVEVEDHLQKARRFYNGAVRILNVRINSFPNVLLAKPAGFSPREYFEIDDAAEREVPRTVLS